MPEIVSVLDTFAMPAAYRAWQGVVFDGANERLYVLTDRNASFGLENIITVLDLNGDVITTHANAHSVTDAQAKFMSFGSGNLIDGVLYTPVYNYNSGGDPLQSKMLEWDVGNLAGGPVEVRDIGGGVAEGVAFFDGHFWVCYNDARSLTRWNTVWESAGTYALPGAPAVIGDFRGEYQTIEWRDNRVYVNLHGFNDATPPGQPLMHVFVWDGSAFRFGHAIQQPTDGTGQGVAWDGTTAYWCDRPENTVVKTSVLPA